MKILTPRSRGVATATAAVLAVAGAATPVQAIDYSVGDMDIRLDATFTAGASWRVSQRANYNLGPANGGADDDFGNSSSGDDSNMNYKRGETFSKVVKVLPELEVLYGDYGAFFRARAFYDFEIMDENRPHYQINDEGLDDVGRSVDLLDAFVFTTFWIGDRPLDVRLGRQAIGWGEAIFAQGGISSVNPLDGNAARLPGAEVKEIILPTLMAYLSFGISDNLSVEGWFRPGGAWEATILPSCGSYFLPRDIAGEPVIGSTASNGCNYLNIGVADSVAGTDRYEDTVAAVGPGLAPSLYIPRDPDLHPDEDEYGVAVRRLFPDWGDMEMALYYQKLNLNGTGLIYGRATTGPHPLAPAVPVGDLATGSYGFMFPEGIDVYGISFNRTAFGYSLQGELAYRPDNPVNFSEPAMVQANILGFTGLIVDANGAVTPGQTLDMIEYADTLQATLGLIGTLSPTDWYDSGSQVFEVVVNHVALSDDIVVIPAALTGGAPVTRHEDVNETAWGYNYRLGLEYYNVGPGLRLSPSLTWSHDVNGKNRSGAGSTLKEGNQTLTLGLGITYQLAHKVNLRYTNFLHEKIHSDNMSDRDFVSIDYTYSL